jgi:DNA-binding NtrC family response regulator
MSTPLLPPILVVDDEPNMRVTIRAILTGEEYRVDLAESAEQALEMLPQKNYLMVVTDARLGGMSGYEFLRQIKQQYPTLPALMITAFATPRLAVEALQAGALDYLSKPFAPEELIHAVERCVERFQLLRENATLKSRSNEVYQLDQIIGECPKIKELRQFIATVAPTTATVLILGESGTGKELVAGAIHALSLRHARNYTRINCAAIPEALLESELFGHEKGSFTGALRQKTGRVEETDGGTIFLDEIGDMSRPLQAKLLRFLEDGSFTRVGGNEELRVNVRIIAATNRDIVKAIQENEFREDLFHRLNVMQFRPPALRERGEDILLLAEHFLKHFSRSLGRSISGMAPATQQKLLHHRWPGNVRELRNVMERAVILESGRVIQPANLPDFHVEARLRPSEEADPFSGGRGLDEVMTDYERQIITAALDRNQHNIQKASDMLKTTRHALRYRMQRLNMTGAEAAVTDGKP